MDIEQLLQDFGVHYETQGHKHCRPGWANTECPFCTGNPGLHLGCHKATGHFYCWRCGWKPAPKAVAALCHISEHRAREIVREYGGRTRGSSKSKEPIPRKPFRFPSDTQPLTVHHKQYLSQRGFDPDHLEREWGLMSTGPVSKLNKADYSHRIVIPIHWDGRVVSFQARDVTGKSNIKYKACPKERERVHHQEILYGDQSKWGRVGACVEGVTDVWRLGQSSFATFGIEFSSHQVRAIKKQFEKVAVVFDDDPQAVLQARKLISELCFRGVRAWSITIEDDPADLSDDEANQLIKEISK